MPIERFFLETVALQILSSQSVDCRLLQTLSLCVCPAFTADISLTMGRILVKLGENVGSLVRLIVYKFHKNWFSFDLIMTSSLFLRFFLREATLLKEKQLCSKLSNSARREKKIYKGVRIMLRKTVTQVTAIFLYFLEL